MSRNYRPDSCLLQICIFALEALLLDLGQIFVLRTSNFRGADASADSSSTETFYCLNSTRKRNIRGWIVVVPGFFFSVNKRVCRK